MNWLWRMETLQVKSYHLIQLREYMIVIENKNDILQLFGASISVEVEYKSAYWNVFEKFVLLKR